MMIGFDASRIIMLRVVIFIFALVFMVKSDESCDIEIENILKTLLSPQENPSLQNRALRYDMLRRLQEGLSKAQEEEDQRNYKSSLTWDSNLPDKRNLEALARAGYVRTLPVGTDQEEEEEDESDMKRSIANLAKNGQLPTYKNNESKRGIESLARNGELHRRREIQELIDELYNKRNIGSLARNYNLPSLGKRFLGSLARSGELPYHPGKRNMASLAREGTRIAGKRGNVAALLRQDNYMNGDLGGIHLSNDVGTEIPQQSGNTNDKRNIASIKAQYPVIKFKRDATFNTRNKREAVVDDYYEEGNYEYPVPVVQNRNFLDYEESSNLLPQLYPNSEKRFLGRLPQMGKPKTTPPPKTRFH